MGFFSRVVDFLGFSRGDHKPKGEDDESSSSSNNNNNNNNNNDDENSDSRAHNRPHFQGTGLPRRGFGVPVQVVVDRPQLGPVIGPCKPGEGGVQGLRWYAKELKIDEDGDVADEFLEEVLPEADPIRRPFPRFAVKHSTKPAEVKKLTLTPDGKIEQCVQCHDRLLWA